MTDTMLSSPMDFMTNKLLVEMIVHRVFVGSERDFGVPVCYLAMVPICSVQ